MRLEPLYQRHREQAKEEGRQEEKQHLILRLLNRRFGEIDASLIERIRGLSIEQLENLGEALLDFSSVADLELWLNPQSE
jgi:predicted transposase YdaD